MDAGLERVVVIPETSRDNRIICAGCFRVSAWRILLDGVPWSTSCGRHVSGLEAAARQSIGLPAIDEKKYPRTT